jgi:MFS family permease
MPGSQISRSTTSQARRSSCSRPDSPLSASATWEIWLLLPVYGIYMGLADGATRAYATDLAVPEARGTVLGWVHMVSGIGSVAASVVAGALWSWIAPAAAFAYGAAGAVAALGLLLAWPPEAAR